MSSSDFNKPEITDHYDLLLLQIRKNQNDLACGLASDTTDPENLPVNSIRWNALNKYWEKLSSNTWDALCDAYNIYVSRAKTADAAEAGGNLDAAIQALNQSVNDRLPLYGGTISGASPAIAFDETDQAGAAGLWRIMATGGALQIQRNTATAGDFSTFDSPISIDQSGLIRNLVQKFTTGSSLPTSDVGTIWHDDYGGFMTWQSFTANGAAYTGYASVTVGSLMFETQPTPRKGYIKSGVSNLSRTAYAALRGWAIHNGIMVASASWAAGSFIFKDNADGTTFTVADVRGEFPRFWDDGRGVDSGRNFGSSQAQDIQQHTHAYSRYGALMTAQAGGSLTVWAGASGVETVSSGSFNGIETRPRNTALLAAIKY